MVFLNLTGWLPFLAGSYFQFFAAASS